MTPIEREPRLVILDMDGVLLDLDLDSERVRDEIAALVQAATGAPRRMVPLMATLRHVIDELEQRDAGAAERLRAQAFAVIDDEELRAAERARARPGAHQLLQALRARGDHLALFTNNHDSAARRALARCGFELSSFFAIEARTGPDAIKPAAEPVLRIIDALGASAGRLPQRMLLVGDHVADMRSAELARIELERRAGHSADAHDVPLLAALAVRGPRSDDQSLEQAGAWFIAADLAEVTSICVAPRIDAGLSIVLLAYDEEESIGRAIVDARRFGRFFFARHQVVVVDDGSRDGTAHEVRAHDEGDVTLVGHANNMGMGASMRDGYAAAQLDYLAHLPGDRQVRPQALAAFLPHAAPHRVVLSHYVAPPSGEQRALVSRIFRALVERIGGLRINFAGTYLFHRHWIEGPAPLDELVSDTFLLSFELLQRFADAGASFAEVQIHNFPRTAGQSREFALARIARVFREIVRYRARAALPAALRSRKST